MKKKLLLKLVASMITASMLLTGCGEQKTDAENVNSTVAQESEAYVQDEEDEKSYTNIDWTWSVSDYELYNTMMKQEEANSELFSGIIDYSDGHQETVKADSVNLIWEDGSTMVVEVEFRGKKFPYKVEIKDNWGDGESLSEEKLEQLKQEEQEQGSEVIDIDIDTSNWNTNVVDLSEASSYDKVRAMNIIFYTWFTSRDGEAEGLEDLIKDINTNPDKYGKDIPYKVVMKEDSEWRKLYGDSSIDEVYRAYGLPGYGDPYICGCRVSKELASRMEALSGIKVEEGHFIMKYPLQSHTLLNMSDEDLREFLVNDWLYTYYFKNNTEGYFDSTGKTRYYADKGILSLYGLSKDGILEKFTNCNPYKEPVDLKWVFNVYKASVDYLGYKGTVFDFYAEDLDVLKDYYKRGVIKALEAEGWQNIDVGLIDYINENNIQLPEYATFKEEGQNTDTEIPFYNNENNSQIPTIKFEERQNTNTELTDYNNER